MKAVAHRYARALADVAHDQNSGERLKAELAAFTELVHESPDLRNFLASPAVARLSKHAVMERLIERLGASQSLRNFLFLLVDNRRTLMLPQIQQAFEAALHERLGIADAQVTSARELTAQERETLLNALVRLTGKRVDARYSLDPELIGGAQVRIGSMVYDGSVRNLLNRLRTRLALE